MDRPTPFELISRVVCAVRAGVRWLMAAARPPSTYVGVGAMNAGQAWALLAAGIAVYELTCADGELMSEGVDRALESHPVSTRLAIAAVAFHLGNLLPARADPLHIAFVGFRKARSRLGLR